MANHRNLAKSKLCDNRKVKLVKSQNEGLLLALVQAAVCSYLTNVTSVFSTLSGVTPKVAIFTLPIFETEFAVASSCLLVRIYTTIRRGQVVSAVIGGLQPQKSVLCICMQTDN